MLQFGEINKTTLTNHYHNFDKSNISIENYSKFWSIVSLFLFGKGRGMLDVTSLKISCSSLHNFIQFNISKEGSHDLGIILHTPVSHQISPTMSTKRLADQAARQWSELGLIKMIFVELFCAFYVVFSSSSFLQAASSSEARLPAQTPLSGTHLTLEQSWWK